MARMTATPTEDGRQRMSFVGYPALSRFQHKDRWRPVDSAQIVGLTTAFYRDPRGVADMTREAVYILGDEDDNEVQVLGKHLADRIVEAQQDPDFITVFATESFAQMMVAAASSSPAELLELPELPAPAGVLHFEVPQDLSFMAGRKDMSRNHGIKRVRGIRWMMGTGGDEGLLFWSVLLDGPDRQRIESLIEVNVYMPEEFYYYTSAYGSAMSPLRTSSIMTAPGAKPMPDEHYRFAALLRSLTAVSRSVQSTQRTSVPAQENRRRRKGRHGAKIADREVRVLSLVNPEHGRYELDAATKAGGATGRHNRRHWVRGHWRNQWYASEKINRYIWVDGFVRGSEELGSVPGARVYAARAPKP